MDAQEIINYIATSEKKTPVKLYVKECEGASVSYGSARALQRLSLAIGLSSRALLSRTQTPLSILISRMTVETPAFLCLT